MNDLFQPIRDALVMGPTRGPRRVIDGYDYPHVTAALPENEGRRWNDPIICALYEDVTAEDYIGFGRCLKAFPNARANAAFIAACDPDTIQELLRRYDELLALAHDYRGIALFLAHRDAAVGNGEGARLMRLTCSRLDDVLYAMEGHNDRPENP